MIHLEGPGPYGLVACKTSNDLCGVSEGEFRRAHAPCKRCLAYLAKRDRAFRLKARRFLDPDRPHTPILTPHT